MSAAASTSSAAVTAAPSRAGGLRLPQFLGYAAGDAAKPSTPLEATTEADEANHSEPTGDEASNDTDTNAA